MEELSAVGANSRKVSAAGEDLDGAAIRFDKALLWALPQLAGGAKAAAAGQMMTGHPVLPWRRLPLCDNRGFSDVAALQTGGAGLQTTRVTPEDTPWYGHLHTSTANPTDLANGRGCRVATASHAHAHAHPQAHAHAERPASGQRLLLKLWHAAAAGTGQRRLLV